MVLIIAVVPVVVKRLKLKMVALFVTLLFQYFPATFSSVVGVSSD